MRAVGRFLIQRCLSSTRPVSESANAQSLLSYSGANFQNNRLTAQRYYSANAAEPEAQTTTPKSEDIHADCKAQIQQLTDEVTELKDKYLRSVAEAQNVRQRLTKQIEDAKLFGIQGFCKQLLEIADILSRASESVPKEALSGENAHLVTLYEGVSMTEKQLQAVFRRNGLEPIQPAKGDKFDPNWHEALFKCPAEPSLPAGSVAVVSKIGYKLHNRTIRPAVVGVAQ